jgi:hypothetical protein
MTTHKKTNVTQRQAADQSMIDGFQKHASTVPSLLLAGTSVPAATFITTLQARIAARADVASAHAAYLAAVQAERETSGQSDPLLSSARQVLGLMFEGQLETLSEFGLKPRKVPAPPTPEQVAERVAKNKATRAARHTMGPLQKAKITGATAPARG